MKKHNRSSLSKSRTKWLQMINDVHIVITVAKRWKLLFFIKHFLENLNGDSIFKLLHCFFFYKTFFSLFHYFIKGESSLWKPLKLKQAVDWMMLFLMDPTFKPKGTSIRCSVRYCQSGVGCGGNKQRNSVDII